MLDITRKINEWTDKKFDEMDFNRDKHTGLKACALGMIDGAVDGFVIVGAVTFIGGVITIIKEVQKNK